MSHRYAGQHPVPDGKGGIVRPGDVWDTPAGDFGPWDEIPPDEVDLEDEEPLPLDVPLSGPPPQPRPVPSPAPPAAPTTATPPAAGKES